MSELFLLYSHYLKCIIGFSTNNVTIICLSFCNFVSMAGEGVERDRPMQSLASYSCPRRERQHHSGIPVYPVFAQRHSRGTSRCVCLPEPMGRHNARLSVCLSPIACGAHRVFSPVHSPDV